MTSYRHSRVHHATHVHPTTIVVIPDYAALQEPLCTGFAVCLLLMA
jgi:hypothetical protein